MKIASVDLHAKFNKGTDIGWRQNADVIELENLFVGELHFGQSGFSRLVEQPMKRTQTVARVMNVFRGKIQLGGNLAVPSLGEPYHHIHVPPGPWPGLGTVNPAPWLGT